MFRSSPFDRASLIADFDAIRISLASPGKDPVLVARRSDQAGNHQLPHLQAGARRPVLRQDFRPGDRLGVPVRQVQAHEAPRRDLRQVRRGSHSVQGAPRAPGPHRTGLALLARVVLQGTAQPHRPPARHFPARPRAHSVLRGLRGDRSRRSAGQRTRDADGRRSTASWSRSIAGQFRAHDGRGSHQGTAEARRRREAVRRTAREDEDRSSAAEAHQVRQAPEGGRGLPQERQQAGVDDSGRDSGAFRRSCARWCRWMAAVSPPPI